MKKIPITDYLYADSETGAQQLNCSRATRSALKAVLPQVIRRELTPQQRRCLELRFGKMMSQQEIARELHVSQPTVSRHLKTALGTLSNRLYYCKSALSRANDSWIKYLE